MSYELIEDMPPSGEKIEFFDFIRRVTYDTEFLFDLYLSGPMSGIPEHNFPFFNAFARKLRSTGLRVFNPAESFNGITDLERSTYLRKDVRMLTKCKAIVLTGGWRDSRGAQLEYIVAKELDLLIFEYKHLMDFYELE